MDIDNVLEQKSKDLDNLLSDIIRISTTSNLNDDSRNELDFLKRLLENTKNKLNNITAYHDDIVNYNIFDGIINDIQQISRLRLSNIENDNQLDAQITLINNAVLDLCNNQSMQLITTHCQTMMQDINNSINRMQMSSNQIDTSRQNINNFSSQRTYTPNTLSKGVANVLESDVIDAARNLKNVNNKLYKFDNVNAQSQHTATEISQRIKDLNRQMRNNDKSVYTGDVLDVITGHLLYAVETAKNVSHSSVENLNDAFFSYNQIYAVKESFDKLINTYSKTTDIALLRLKPDSKITKDIERELSRVNNTLLQQIEQHNSDIQKSFREDLNNDDITLQMSKQYIQSIQPTNPDITALRNIAISNENNKHKIPFIQQKTYLSSEYQAMEQLSLRHSFTNSQSVKNSKQHILNSNNKAETSVLLSSLTAPVVSDANMALTKSMTLIDRDYHKMSDHEKQNYDKVHQEIKKQIANTINLINSYELIDPNNKYIDELKTINIELVKREQAMAKTKNDKVKHETITEKAKNFVNFFTNPINGLLSLMGLSGLLSISKLFNDMQQRYISNEKAMYQAAKADQSLGANIASDENHRRVYNLGAHYQYISGMQIKPTDLNDYYVKLAKTIGGRYNSNPEQNRRDLAQLAEILFPLKEANGLDNNDFDKLATHYFKNLGQDVNTTADKIANVLAQARETGTPVKLYLNQISNVVEKTYDLGANADQATEVIFDLTKHGMLIEDATNIVLSSMKVSQTFGNNQTQVAYFGAMSGMGFNLFGNMVQGRIFKDRFGKPVQNYHSTMGQALMAKYNMYDDILSVPGSESMSLAYFGRLLKEDGFSDKEVSQMMSLKQEGKYDKIEEIIIGNIDKPYKKRAELKESVSSATQAIANMGNQLAETTKILAEREKAIVKLSEMWKKYFAPYVNKVVDYIGKMLQQLPGLASRFVKFIKDLMDDSRFKQITELWGDNPLATFAILTVGVPIGLKVGWEATKLGYQFAKNKIVNGVNRPTGFRHWGKVKTGGKIALGLGIGIGAVELSDTVKNTFNQYKKAINQDSKLAQQGINDNHSKFYEQLQSGAVKIQLLDENGEIIESLDYDDSTEQEKTLDFINKASTIGWSIFFTRMWFNNISPIFTNNKLKVLKHSYIVSRYTEKDIRRIALKRRELFDRFGRIFKQHLNILHPSNMSLRRVFREISRMPKTLHQITSAKLQASSIPRAYRQQYMKFFNTETPQIKSIRDYLKLKTANTAGWFGELKGSYQEFKLANRTYNGMLANGLKLGGSMLKGNLLFSGINEVIDAYVIGNNRSMGERAARIGIDVASSTAGAAIGATLGSAFFGIGAVPGAIIGGLLGGMYGRYQQDQLGIGEKMSAATRKWLETMDKNPDIYNVDVMEIIKSNTDMGQDVRDLLKRNGLDLGKLTDTQNAILDEMLSKYKEQHMTFEQLLIKMIQLAHDSSFTEWGTQYDSNGNLIGLSKYANDNNVLARFYEEMAKNYDEDSELNILYTHLANYYDHPNAGTDDKEYWENEMQSMREYAHVTEDDGEEKFEFAQRLRRNYLEMLQNNGVSLLSLISLYKNSYGGVDTLKDNIQQRLQGILSKNEIDSLMRVFDSLTQERLNQLSQPEMYGDPDNVMVDLNNAYKKEIPILYKAIAILQLQSIDLHNTVKLWQHMAEVIKSQPSIRHDLESYIKENYDTSSITGEIPMWLQGDSRWGGMNHGSGSMAGSGCFATSAAMMRAIYTGERIDPGQFLQKGLWQGAANAEWYRKLQMRQVDPSSYEDAVALVRKQLQAGKPILAVHSGLDTIHTNPNSIGHVVVYVGYNQDGTIRVHDPAQGIRNISERELLANAGKAGGNQGYKYQVGFDITDLSPAAKISPGKLPNTPISSSTKANMSSLAKLKMSHPNYYRWVLQYSKKYNVNPELVAATMEVESGFNPNAVSEAGAQGLMQFMPRTAAGWGIDPFDPEQSIDAGAHFLGNMSKQFHGDVRAVAAGYNVGANYEPLKKYKKPHDFNSFNLNELPAETRNHVLKVMARMSGTSISGGAGSGTSGGIDLKTFQPPKPLTYKEHQERAMEHMMKAGKVIASGYLVDNMNVSSTGETLDQQRLRIMKKYNIPTKNFDTKIKQQYKKTNDTLSMQIKSDINKQKQRINQEMQALKEKQEAKKKAEKANIGDIKIFGIMKKNHSSEDMQKEIHETLNSNRWTKFVKTTDVG